MNCQSYSNIILLKHLEIENHKNLFKIPKYKIFNIYRLRYLRKGHRKIKESNFQSRAGYKLSLLK